MLQDETDAVQRLFSTKERAAVGASGPIERWRSPGTGRFGLHLAHLLGSGSLYLANMVARMASCQGQPTL